MVQDFFHQQYSDHHSLLTFWCKLSDSFTGAKTDIGNFDSSATARGYAIDYIGVIVPFPHAFDHWDDFRESRGHYIASPKQCIVIREIPQNYHRFVLFDSAKMGPI